MRRHPERDQALKSYDNGWYVLCLLAGLSLAALPVLWRSELFPLMLLGYPLAAVLLFTFMVYWLSQRWLTFPHVVLALVPILAGLYLGFKWDRGARDLIFSWNVPAYRLLVRNLAQTPPPRFRTEIHRDLLMGFGVYRGHMETIEGRLVIKIDTCSGPSLETVAFTRQPMDSLGELKLKDELGYWYYL